MASLTTIAAELRRFFGTSIPPIIDLLKDDVSNSGVGSLTKHWFRGAIQTSIPQIIDLLQYSDWSVRFESANALSKFSEQRTYHIRPGMALLTSIAAELRQFIGTAIPQIIDRGVREMGALVLSQLSEQAELQQLIGTAIPQIIDLLQHSNCSARTGGAKALFNLSEQGIQHTRYGVADEECSPPPGFIGVSIPLIIDLLKNEDSQVRCVSVDVLSKLSDQADLRRFIGTSIPQIIDLLKDNDTQVRCLSVNVLSRLSDEADFGRFIGTSIPQIIDLLKDDDSQVRAVGAAVLSKLSKHAKLRRFIGTCIPQITDLLQDDDSDVRAVGAEVVSKLSKQGEVAGSNPTLEATEQVFDSMATTNIAGPSRSKDNAGSKIPKVAKIKELHAFFVTLFNRHSVPLETTSKAEARLPWKNMPSVLAEQGLKISGWPEGVPEPRSDGKADKGISGFNTKHIEALYNAMKAHQIDFLPLTGARDLSRVRQREDDMEEEVEVRPSKKGKLAATRKKPKDFVAMQSVMKF
ncbi:armadillo-type protein [Mycena galericulata]|nr:armadillo-type protein [Mycena galericulata]